MSEIIIDTHATEGVVEIRLDRPKKKNAVTIAMYRAMNEALSAAAADAKVGAVVFSGNGETFCAGNDVLDFMNGIGGGADDEPPVARFIRTIATFEKPMVAAVHGAAVGVGTTMLLHCDLVYASETARLHTPFVSLGLVPEAASSLLLPRRIGYARAAEMILLGTPIDALRARDLGLVNAVVPHGELRAHALGKAAELARLPPNALRISRALLRGSPDEVSARIEEEGRHFMAALGGAEAREAFMAFMERRPADFRNLT